MIKVSVNIRNTIAKTGSISILLFCFMIITLNLDAYKLSFFPQILNLSLARLTAIILFLISCIKILSSKKINNLVTMLFLFLIYVSVVSLIGLKTANNYSLMFFYVIILFIITAEIVRNSNLHQLKLITSAFRISIIILIIFAIYTYSIFFTIGHHPSELPIGKFTFFFTIRNEGHIFNQGGFSLGDLTRLSLPFSRPQELGASTTTLFFLFLILKKVSNSSYKIDYILFFSLIAITFLTGSKSAVFPLIAGIFFYYFKTFKLSGKTWRSSKFISLIIIIALLILNAIKYDNIFSNFERLFSNFDSTTYVVHFSVRISALKIAFSDIYSFFLGHGIGGFNEITDISSAHSTFFTLLVDIGLIGLIFFINLHSRVLLYNNISNEMKILFQAIFIVIMLSHLFYNLITTTIFYITLGIIYGIKQNKIIIHG
jgi:hypothetical protein